MAISKNPFKDLLIDRKSMEGAVRAVGADKYSYTKVGNSYQMGFALDGADYRIAVYENKDGTTTLSKLGTNDDVFHKVATAVRDSCSVGGGGRFDLAIPRFDKGNFGNLLEYLTEQEVQTERDVTENGYRLVKLKSPQGDSMVVKLFDNGTLHMQGRRAMMASMALDFLSNVLNYEEAVKAQLDTFAVPVKVSEVRNEVEGKLVRSFAHVNAVVQAQLTTALALSKVEIELPDYSPVAFPALKGLEGFLKVELENAGLKPGPQATFAEYFEKNPSGIGHQMREVQSQHVGEPVATILAECYTVYSDERHGIAHVGTDAHNTRILPDLLTAVRIVEKVFSTIETTCIKLKK